MSDRQKSAHLLRRLGLGATRAELATAERIGPGAAGRQLIGYAATADDFPVSPWQFCHDEGVAETYLDPFRTAFWWSLRMAMSTRPLEERLTLFWHDHFAVSGEKVEFGPSMQDYLAAIRQNASGKFPALLQGVTQTAAMARYLDLDTSYRGHPNENFARELLELFTTGPGPYSEEDIKEVARVFTGYGIRYLVFEAGGERVQERAKDFIEKGLPLVTFAFSPGLNDPGERQILGEKGPSDAAALLHRLAAREETARHICQKLWNFCGAPGSSPAVAEMVSEFRKSEGDIARTLQAMVTTGEFWKSERKLVKSPFDFVVPIVRQFELSPVLRTLSGTNAKPTTPVAKPLRDTAGLIFGTMARMGLSPLFPPNVGGWTWGEAWISPNNMIARINFADLIFGVGQPEQPLAGYLATQILSRKPASEREAVQDFLTTFDAELPEAKVKLVQQAFEKSGGLDSLRKPQTASTSLSAMGRLVFGAPEFQLF